MGLGVIRFTTSEVIATRGERLLLGRTRWFGHDQRSDAFHTEVLTVVEIGTDEKVVGRVWFDSDDLDAAFEELDARYLAGEAAVHADTWSVIARNIGAFNRHELPGWTPDAVNIDHRRVTAFAPGDVSAYIDATWDEMPDARICIEAVHRLSDRGAVVTHVSHGTSQQGFEAEWRGITVSMIEGDLISTSDLFDEADLDDALARFDELSRAQRRLENLASQVLEGFNTRFAAGDWDAMAEMLAADHCSDDRRRVVGAGLRLGRDAEIEDLQGVAAQFETMDTTAAVIATRGERLVLCRACFSGQVQQAEALQWELLGIVEIDTDARIAAFLTFDLDDIDAAFEELDARYLAGEAAANAQTWSVITRVYAGFNRHELPATTQDLVTIDHRPLVTVEAGGMAAHIRSVLDQMPNLSIYIETVHRLTDIGVVVTHAAHGVSRDGFDAEWRMVFIYTVDDELISSYELFDEADIDAALARFDELGPQVPDA